MKKTVLCATALLLSASTLLSGCAGSSTVEDLQNLQSTEEADELVQEIESYLKETESPVPETENKLEETESTEVAAADDQADFYDTPLVGVASDYSNPDNWMIVPEKITKDVDTFYIYPTIITDADENAQKIVDIDNIIMQIGAYFTYEKNATVFDESTNIFAPYYRQTNMAAVADLRGQDLEDFHKQEQRTDIYAALDYYFENYNEGRPFILAAHSQGSIISKIALEEYFRLHPEYYDRMIAAYLIGFSVTKSDLEKYPHLKFAEGPDDTGVIVSWNTEGPGNKNADNIVVEEGATAINPITYTRDDTYVPASENLGSRVDNMAGATEEEWVMSQYDINQLNMEETTVPDLVKGVIESFFNEKHPGIGDAQVDPERGVVICTTDQVPYMEVIDPNMPNVFGPASFHGCDYSMYYYSIQENVKERIESWNKSNKQ